MTKVEKPNRHEHTLEKRDKLVLRQNRTRRVIQSLVIPAHKAFILLAVIADEELEAECVSVLTTRIFEQTLGLI